MSFANIFAERRTDESFRNRSDKDHHKETSPFERLEIDMIYAFTSSDTLHLLDLGIMKRCLIRWVFGEKMYNRKWSKINVDYASRLLENSQKFMPKEIHRAIRNLKCLRKWKGLEFRTVLVYVGIVVFKNILSKEEYDHFLILFCAVRICLCKVYKDKLPIAEKMFQSYIKNYSILYGKQSIGSNVHILAHIVEDMKHSNVENIMELSTYKYENCLRLIGLKLKHGHLPLEQVSRRILEGMQLHANNEKNIFESKQFSPQVFYPKQRGTTFLYSKIQITPDVMITSRKFADSWFLTKLDDIVKMEYVIKRGDKNIIFGMSVVNKSEFFVNPITSTKSKIFASDGKTSNELQSFEIHSIIAKMICLPHENQFVYIPLVHSLDSLNFQ